MFRGSRCDDSLHLQSCFGKVHEETMLTTRRSQVGPDDHEVDALEAFHGLELDNNLIVDQEVQPMATDLKPAREHRDRRLTPKEDPAGSKLNRQCILVD